MRRPRAETVQGCERSHEAVERDAAVEAHAILDDGAGERADRFTTSRHETDARVVGAGKRRGRRERVREPQRLEPRHTGAEPLDEAPADRVRRRDRHLLPDDRAHSQFERAPRPRRAHARALTDQPPDDPVGGQDADGLIEVEIEVRDVASPLHDVHELFPVGQMGPQQQMVVPTWTELEDTGRAHRPRSSSDTCLRRRFLRRGSRGRRSSRAAPASRVGRSTGASGRVRRPPRAGLPCGAALVERLATPGRPPGRRD